MRIAWLQDMDIFSGGGAQNTDAAHFLEGIRRGHDLVPVIAAHGGVEDLSVPYDAFIISNVRSFPMEVLQNLARTGAPYVVFHHDSYCKWRNFFPMEEKCHSCYLKDRWLPIFEKAATHVFLSPLHREATLWIYPEIQDMNFALIPSPVRPDLFKDMHQPRAGALAVNSHLEYKGRSQFLQYAVDHPELQITLVGANPDEPGLPENIKPIGQVSYGRMPELYNLHKSFIHLPVNPMAFERTVAEAYLTGCELIVNPNVGALSYSWFKDRVMVAAQLASAPVLFWHAVEEAFK